MFVGSKFHGQEERKDGPVVAMQVQESGNSDFQSLISLPHIPSTFKIEMCKCCSKLEMSLVVLLF